MKITKQHRECFRKALELFNGEDYNFLCTLILKTNADDAIIIQCQELVRYYFSDGRLCENLWGAYSENLTLEETNNCRLIALYTLIYAPL
jgi:hypothetical protein